jgi:hypothetical protein
VRKKFNFSKGHKIGEPEDYGNNQNSSTFRAESAAISQFRAVVRAEATLPNT